MNKILSSYNINQMHKHNCSITIKRIKTFMNLQFLKSFSSDLNRMNYNSILAKNSDSSLCPKILKHSKSYSTLIDSFSNTKMIDKNNVSELKDSKSEILFNSSKTTVPYHKILTLDNCISTIGSFFQWQINPANYVEKNTTIASIITLDKVFDLEINESGYLIYLKPTNSKVILGEVSFYYIFRNLLL